MNTQEIGNFLGLVALHDNRKIGTGDIMAWEDVLPPGISFDDARAALRAHRQAGPDWLMPSHIIEGVRAIRRERLKRYGPPPIPGELDQAQERAWAKLWWSAIKDGKDDPASVANAELGISPVELPPNPAMARAVESLVSNSKAVNS